MLDPEHEFFQPVWRRIAIIAITAGWGLLEFLIGEPFCFWKFFGTSTSAQDASKPSDD
jgi:hypothetical protein